MSSESGHRLAICAEHLDELTAEFPLEEKDIGMKLMTDMYGEASKRLGLDVLVTGTAQAGPDWYSIH